MHQDEGQDIHVVVTLEGLGQYIFSTYCVVLLTVRRHTKMKHVVLFLARYAPQRKLLSVDT